MAGIKTGISGQINNNIVTDGLIFYVDPAYKKSYLGSGADTFNLASGSLTPTGSISGATFEGPLTSSWNFDGSDDLINLSTQIDITENKSISLWIKRDTLSPSNDGGIFTMVPTGGTSDLLSIGLWQSNIQALTAVGVRQRSLQTISINIWYHVVVVKSTNSITNIYINGVDETLDNEGSWNGTPANPQSKIGEAIYDGTNYNFYGNIGPVQVYNKTLSSTEVLQNYQAQKERFGL